MQADTVDVWGRAEKLKVEKLTGTCFLAFLSLPVAVGRLPGKGEYARMVVMDLVFAEFYIYLVI